MNEVNNKVLQNTEIFDFVLFCEVLITYYLPKNPLPFLEGRNSEKWIDKK